MKPKDFKKAYIQWVYHRFRLIPAYATTLTILASYFKFTLLRLLFGHRWAKRNRSKSLKKNARRIKRCILKLNGLFIKVGQMISILSHYLPAEFRSELEGLQDKVPPRPYHQTQATIHSELGQSPEKLFKEFNPIPLASASLAQVHKATLFDGREVAIKIQHSDIQQTSTLDLDTFRHILGLVKFFTPIKGLEHYYLQVKKMIEEELDFTKEANNLLTLKEKLSHTQGVYVPKLISELCSQRILTTEYIDGIKISEVKQSRYSAHRKQKIAEKLLDVYCDMIFNFGIYHADPHPGNLLLLPDDTLVFIDFGAVSTLSPAVKQEIPKFIQAALHQNTDHMIASLRTMGFIDPLGDDQIFIKLIHYYLDRFDLRQGYEHFQLKDFNTNIAKELHTLLDFRKLGLSINEMMRLIKIPNDWVLLQRTAVILLGVSTDLAPDIKPVAIVRPYLKEIVFDEDADWLEFFAQSIKEVALALVTTPEQLRELLLKANRGDLTVKVEGLQENASIIRSIGRQLILSFFSISLGALSYIAYIRHDQTIMLSALCGAGLSILLTLRLALNAPRHR
ncbi:MAG: hypothetical protein COB51_03675 [Moraxellaceae bacterium]|nr:MAG: hypothetical protein COB51_03675 [Moraxellaceae bacterium]